ncbi:ABC transporter substrate-binding protein [Aliikangiella maris]|uniref:PhnD/SsuA/transferrin family substrate-binding protein n=2 Tax=Aliikangiella maris TaxID=3162458 RepID=A0ABV2BX09_9GAMM
MSLKQPMPNQVISRQNNFKLFWIVLCCLTFHPIVNAVEESVKQPRLEKLVLSGPIVSVSHPFIKMIKSHALSDVAKQVEFKVWKNPDQMRALTLQGDVDLMAMPTNVAANLYNKGVDLKLLNVSVWGMLWMISREKDLTKLSDFKGKEIAIPFRGDMPDIIFNTLSKASGLEPEKDFKLKYVASPFDAMQLLVTRRIDHALLAEPAVSMALRKVQTFPLSTVAPDLYRSVDLQQEWARLLKRAPQIPQAGIAVINNKLSDKVIQRFNEEYQKALQWCQTFPKLAGEMVAPEIEMLTADAVMDSIPVSRLNAVEALKAKPELQYFYQLLYDNKPALIGGKMPDDAFYYSTKAIQNQVSQLAQ